MNTKLDATNILIEAIEYAIKRIYDLISSNRSYRSLYEPVLNSLSDILFKAMELKKELTEGSVLIHHFLIADIKRQGESLKKGLNNKYSDVLFPHFVSITSAIRGL